MAKGLRSSIKKSNRSKLRAKIFQPVEDSRTERLSAKLLELASQPRPTRTEMEVDTDKSESLPGEAVQQQQHKQQQQQPHQQQQQRHMITSNPLTAATTTTTNEKNSQQQDAEPQSEAMDIDQPSSSKSRSRSKSNKSAKVQKRRYRKPSSTITFHSIKKSTTSRRKGSKR